MSSGARYQRVTTCCVSWRSIEGFSPSTPAPSTSSYMSSGERGYASLFRFFVLGIHLARKAEIDDLHVAFAVDEDVGGLQVAVHQVPALHVEESAEELVEERLHVALTPSADALVVPNDLRKVPSSILLAVIRTP